VSTTMTKASTRAQLEALAREQRRELCGRCGGSPMRPCTRCATQRRRIVELYDDYRPLAAIAADVGLPTWRVEQILDEQLPGDRATIDARTINAELLRPELMGLVDVILAGPRPLANEGWHFEKPKHWYLWVRLSLELVGWNTRSVSNVLDGTHIPNRPLRERVEVARAAHVRVTGEPLTSTLLADKAGIASGCGTYFDRIIGARPTTVTRRRGHAYGGHTLRAISREYATRIADAIGVAHRDIPGL